MISSKENLQYVLKLLAQKFKGFQASSKDVSLMNELWDDEDVVALRRHFEGTGRAEDANLANGAVARFMEAKKSGGRGGSSAEVPAGAKVLTKLSKKDVIAQDAAEIGKEIVQGQKKKKAQKAYDEGTDRVELIKKLATTSKNPAPPDVVASTATRLEKGLETNYSARDFLRRLTGESLKEESLAVSYLQNRIPRGQVAVEILPRLKELAKTKPTEAQKAFHDLVDGIANETSIRLPKGLPKDPRFLAAIGKASLKGASQTKPSVKEAPKTADATSPSPPGTPESTGGPTPPPGTPPTTGPTSTPGPTPTGTPTPTGDPTGVVDDVAQKRASNIAYVVGTAKPADLNRLNKELEKLFKQKPAHLTEEGWRQHLESRIELHAAMTEKFEGRKPDRSNYPPFPGDAKPPAGPPPGAAGAPPPAAQAAPKTVEQLLEQKLPKGKEPFKAAFDQLLDDLSGASQEGEVMATGLRNVAAKGGPEALQKFGGAKASEMVERVAAGKLAPQGFLGKFVKSLGGMVGTETVGEAIGPSKRYKATEALIKAADAGDKGLSQFAGTLPKLKNVGKELVSFRLGLPLLFAGLAIKGAMDQGKVAKQIREEQIVPSTSKRLMTAEEMKDQIELQEMVMQRRATLEKSPELMADVTRILRGQEPAKNLTASEIQIGRVSKGRDPMETQQLMDILLGRLSTYDKQSKSVQGLSTDDILMPRE